MMKKVLALLVSVVLILGAFSSVSAASFSDVTKSYDWAQEAIETLAEKKVITGYPDGTFKPGNNITKQEAITLFARCLGSDEALNEAVLSVATLNAESVLAKYDSYALSQAAYLLYKKVLGEDELATYLSAANKDVPLKRYEAAVLIAKSLGGEVWLKSNPDVKSDFADANLIPATAQGYVYYASELGIIQGMGDNKFEPNGNVTRAQISVMINRILNMMQYSYSSWTVADVDVDLNVVTLRDTEGETEKYTIGSSVPVMIDGTKSALSDLEGGMEVVLTFTRDFDTETDRLYSLDAISLNIDETLEGIYRGKTTDNSGTTVTISDIENKTTKSSYKLASNVAVKYNGLSASLSDYKEGDHVFLEIVSGKVAVIDAAPKSTTINGATVVSIPSSTDANLVVKTKNGEEMELALATGATLKRNGSSAEFRSLAVGDSIDLELQYGRILKATATGVTKDIEAVIESIYHSSEESKIGVKKGSTVTTYTVSRDATITMNGEKVTLYELRVGYTVKLKTSSLSVTSITVVSSAISTQRSVTGMITAINPDWGMIQVDVVSPDGDVVSQQVFLKKGVTILNSATGKAVDASKLTVGMNILAAGTESGGIFETNSVMILSK